MSPVTKQIPAAALPPGDARLLEVIAAPEYPGTDWPGLGPAAKPADPGALADAEPQGPPGILPVVDRPRGSEILSLFGPVDTPTTSPGSPLFPAGAPGGAHARIPGSPRAAAVRLEGSATGGQPSASLAGPAPAPVGPHRLLPATGRFGEVLSRLGTYRKVWFIVVGCAGFIGLLAVASFGGATQGIWTPPAADAGPGAPAVTAPASGSTTTVRLAAAPSDPGGRTSEAGPVGDGAAVLDLRVEPDRSPATTSTPSSPADPTAAVEAATTVPTVEPAPTGQAPATETPAIDTSTTVAVATSGPESTAPPPSPPAVEPETPTTEPDPPTTDAPPAGSPVTAPKEEQP